MIALFSALLFALVGFAARAHGPADHSACEACHLHGSDELGRDHGQPSDAGPVHDSDSDPESDRDGGDGCSLCHVLASPGVPLSLPAPLPLPDAVLVARSPAPTVVESNEVLLLGLARGPPDVARFQPRAREGR